MITLALPVPNTQIGGFTNSRCGRRRCNIQTAFEKCVVSEPRARREWLPGGIERSTIGSPLYPRPLSSRISPPKKGNQKNSKNGPFS